jgi:hypothetical protein
MLLHACTDTVEESIEALRKSRLEQAGGSDQILATVSSASTKRAAVVSEVR